MSNDLIRILWQSSTPIGGIPEYFDAIEQHAKRVLADTTALEIRGVTVGSSDLHFRSIDFLNNVQVFESCRRAESEGYDAVALGCFVDPVLDEIREVVDIPALGMAQTGMHVACMMGRKFAVLTRTSAFSPKFHAELVRRYGLEAQCSGLYPFDCDFDDVTAGLRGENDKALKQLCTVAAVAAGDGAEVLLVGCGLLNLIAVRAGLGQIDGASFLDVSGALMKMSEAMVTLRRTSGLQTPRNGLYEKPTESQLESALSIYKIGE